MTLKEESVIEMIAYTKRKVFVAIFHDSFTIQKMSYHTGCLYRDVTKEKSGKKKRTSDKRITQNNKDLKQFSYITSHNLRAPLSNLTGLLNLIDDIPLKTLNLKNKNGFSKSTHLLNRRSMT
jgi:hypothetical protein